MKKKFLLGLLLVFIFSLASFTYTLATDNGMLGNAADGARNMVQNAENAVENTALDVSNASRNMTENFENTMNNTMDFDNATINETTNTEADDMDTGYTATRTSTDLYDAGTTMGINNNAWIWIIIALATTAIVILAYSYATQNNYRDRNTDND